MKKRFAGAIFLLSSIVMSSCLSFRIFPSFPQEGHVERMVFCEDVDESGELLEPLEIRYEFVDDAESVFCFFEIKNISRKIGMRWRWYAPDRSLSRDSGNVTINEEEKLLEIVTAYDELMLGIREKEKKIGRWTVIVLIDDSLVARRTFDVRQKDKKIWFSSILCGGRKL
jgi:hypothetical protein